MSFCVIDTGLIITANHGILFFVNVYKYLTFKIKFHISYFTYNNNILLSAVGLLPGGSGYFACKQSMKLATTKFKSGGLHEKHVVATWNLGNHLSICL